MSRLSLFALLLVAVVPQPLLAQAASTSAPLGVHAPNNVIAIARSVSSSFHEQVASYDRRIARRFTLGLAADVHPSQGLAQYEHTRPTGIDRVELVGRYYLIGSAFRGLSLGVQAGAQRVWDDGNHDRQQRRLTNALALDYQSMVGSGRWKLAWSTGIVARNILHNSPAPAEWGYGQMLGLRVSLGVAR